MYDRAKIMRRAWELARDPQLGYSRFGDALRDAWAEAKGALSFLQEEPPRQREPLDPTLVMARLARTQLTSLGKSRRRRGSRSRNLFS